jgi:hypothetical protein
MQMRVAVGCKLVQATLLPLLSLLLLLVTGDGVL